MSTTARMFFIYLFFTSTFHSFLLCDQADRFDEVLPTGHITRGTAGHEPPARLEHWFMSMRIFPSPCQAPIYQAAPQPRGSRTVRYSGEPGRKAGKGGCASGERKKIGVDLRREVPTDSVCSDSRTPLSVDFFFMASPCARTPPPRFFA